MTTSTGLVGFKYEGLYQAIRRQLEQLPLPKSGPLFTEKELEERYGASRTTVRKALNLLEQEGYIVRKPRLGTFPGATLLSDPAPATWSGMTGRANDLSSRLSLKEIETSWVRPPRQILKELELERPEKVLRFYRVRDAGDGALTSMTTWFRPDVGRVVDVEKLSTAPPLNLLEEAGLAISNSVQRLTARNANAALAAQIAIKKGAAMFINKSTVFDSDARPVSYSEHCSSADRFEFRMTLETDGTIGLRDIVRLPAKKG